MEEVPFEVAGKICSSFQEKLKKPNFQKRQRLCNHHGSSTRLKYKQTDVKLLREV